MDKREYAKQRLKERSASKRFKLPEGETTFRMLPNKNPDAPADFAEYRMHSNVGPQNRYVRCGLNFRGTKGKCWLCDKVKELEESKKSSRRAYAAKIQSVCKFGIQIIYLSDGKWLGPTLWEMPQGIANGLLGVMNRKEVVDLRKGHNLTVSRAGTTFKGTKYGSILVDDESSKVPTSLAEARKSFKELLQQYSETEQKNAFYGREQEEGEEEEENVNESVEEQEETTEEEDETPKKPGKKQRREEPEDEEPEGEENDEVDDEDISNLQDEDEEENEKPAGKKGTKKVSKHEKEEEPEEEDEDEPKTKKGKKVSKPAEDEEPEEEDY